jgi:hypothetical protein
LIACGRVKYEKLRAYPRKLLDESDPDIVILRRSSGGFVAAFSARGVTQRSIIEAAHEDYRQLIARALAGESGRRAPSIDELPEHVAIVDRSGTIMAVNKAWKRFARNNRAEPSKVSVGVNYLGVCERATGDKRSRLRSPVVRNGWNFS